MKDVWDSILKTIPPDVIPVMLLLAAAFFGTYYYKGFRNYTDALNDRWFLNIAVVILAFSAMYWLQKPRGTHVEEGTTIALLVPRFEDDEGRQIENLFTQQVQAAIHALQPKAVVVQTDSYVRDRETARLTVKAGNALAAVFQPRVIRIKDKMLTCFSLLIRDQETTTPFPPVAAELDKSTLSELSSTIITISSMAFNQSSQDIVLARLRTIEQRIDGLSSALLRVTAENQLSETINYHKTRAIVIGINDYQSNQFPHLAGAVTDAQGVASLLRDNGFDVTLLVDNGATAAKMKEAFDRAAADTQTGDVLLFYYSGMSFRSTDLIRNSPSKDLWLPPYDFSFETPQDSNTLLSLVERAKEIKGDTLMILDGCHGTFGLHDGLLPPSAGHGTLQILSGTQDDELAADTPSGGIFTQALLRLLMSIGPGKALSTTDLLARITPEVVKASANRQHPKLLTLAGGIDVRITGHRAAIP